MTTSVKISQENKVVGPTSLKLRWAREELMPNYTLCLLIRADLAEVERKKILQDLEKSLNSQTKPKISEWGRKDLVYPIAKQTQAFYYLVDFEGEPETASNLDKKFKLAENVLRFLVVRRKATKAAKVTKATKATKETKTAKRKK